MFNTSSNVSVDSNEGQMTQTQNPETDPSRNSKKKKRKKTFLITLTSILVLVFIVQTFVYPFLIQKASFGHISILAIKKLEPGEDVKEVSEAEIKKVQKYAAHIKNSYSWQLRGLEKSFFNRLDQMLKDASPENEESTFGFLDFGFVVTAYAEDINTLSKEQISSDMASMAAILQQFGYEKLSLALLAAAAEGNPIDPVVINNLACALRGYGEKQDAYKLLSFAYKLDPSNIDVLINLGHTSLDMEDLNRASAWFSEALSIDDEAGLAHEGLMLCYMAEENYPVAMRHMIKAAKQCFTPAIQKTYDKLKYLKNYNDIRDQVLKGFTLAEIAETYERPGRVEVNEGIDVPEVQLRIPKFPVYADAKTFINNVDAMHDFAMSILEPGIGQFNEYLEIAKSGEILESMQENGVKGILEALGIGISESSPQQTASMDGDTLSLPVTNEREAFTVHLMGDYIDMKIDEYTSEMLNGYEKKAYDPILAIHERNQREIKSRGFNAEVWLREMANSFGNSGSLSNPTIRDNQTSINQHLEAFYQAVLPAYNGLKPELEEYWLRTGGVIKYVSDDKIFESLEKERKFKVSGSLAIFGMMAETEVINVPLLYAGAATGGNAEQQFQEQAPELFEMPQEGQKGPEFFISLGIKDVFSIEMTNNEVSAEFTLLISAGIKHNFNERTTTLTVGGGLDSGSFIPVFSGGITEGRYYTFKNGKLTDHGHINKKTTSVNAGVFNIGSRHAVTITTKVSCVTSTVERNIERMVAGNFLAGSIGAKRESKL